LIGLTGLCGIGFCVGAGAALYVENSHFWTTEAIAIAASENKAQAVNRSRKGDRLPVSRIDPSTRAAGPRDGFGMLEVGGRLNATIRIRDADGRPVFELDPVRRRTVISKREGRGVPPSKEQGGQSAPKSRDVPEIPAKSDPPRSRLAGSGLLELVEESHSRAQNDAERQASLSSSPGR